MVGGKAFWPLVGVALVVAHVALAFGACSLIFWLYFDAGVRWTPDPVIPQIQGVLATVGMSLTALILTPAGLAARKHTRWGVPIAICWPLASAVCAFVPPLILAWIPLGIWLLRKPAPPTQA